MVASFQFLTGQHTGCVETAAKEAEKHPDGNGIDTEKEAGGRHQLDVAAAEGSRYRDGQKKHRQGYDHGTDQAIGQSVGRRKEELYKTQSCDDEMKAIIDKAGVPVDQGHHPEYSKIAKNHRALQGDKLGVSICKL